MTAAGAPVSSDGPRALGDQVASVPVAAGRDSVATAALTLLGGRRVAWFRVEGGKHRGAIGPVEGEVLERLVRLAVEAGVPVVGELSTSGADVHAGLPALHAWGRLARALADASGVVPILLSVVGPCVSGPALLLGMADHVVITSDGFAYLSGPEAVAEFTGAVHTRTALGGADVHHQRTGVASLVVDDDEDGRWAMAELLSYLPDNWAGEPPTLPGEDPVERPCRAAAAAVPARANASYDVRRVIEDVVDEDSFLEVRAANAPNMVTGYASLGGRAVGVVANQPAQLAGTVDIEASRKAARFVQGCDAFGLPLLTFIDTPGFQPGRDLEWRGMIRHGAELVHAYAAATVPRLAVVLRKAYGGAYIVMDSRPLGNDLYLAWPGAEIAVMGPSGAVQVLHGKRLAEIEDEGERSRVQAELEADYTARHCTAAVAADRGYVDRVVAPADTRRVLGVALAALATKRRVSPSGPRKHSNTPL